MNASWCQRTYKCIFWLLNLNSPKSLSIFGSWTWDNPWLNKLHYHSATCQLVHFLGLSLRPLIALSWLDEIYHLVCSNHRHKAPKTHFLSTIVELLVCNVTCVGFLGLWKTPDSAQGGTLPLIQFLRDWTLYTHSVTSKNRVIFMKESLVSLNILINSTSNDTICIPLWNMGWRTLWSSCVVLGSFSFVSVLFSLHLFHCFRCFLCRSSHQTLIAR